MRIYLDSAPIIYHVERVEPFSARVDARFLDDGLPVTSELARLESRVRPLREGDQDLLHDFDVYFAEFIGELLPLSREVVGLATEIRAEHRFAVPDALHLAAAVWFECDVSLTNDQALQRFPSLAVELV